MVSSGDLSEPSKPPVWQPLTFGGVAGFARVRWTRLLLLQGIVAALVAVNVVLLLGRGWFPVVTQAVQGLNDFGAVRGARLAWPAKEAVVLAENRFLGLVVDLEESGGTGQIADLQIEFSRERIKVVSLLGYTSLPYPGGVEIELNRQTLDPWWNAWRPAFMFGGAFGTMLFLFASWSALAVLYAVPVRVLAWFAGRAASPGKSWRVAAAALLPGAVWMGGAVFLYAVEQLSLVGLGAAFGLHFVVGWVYVLGAPFCLPRKDADPLATGTNPFTPAPAAEAQPPASPAPSASSNPFQSPPPPPPDNG
ncbi:MAG: Uncharacterized protein FD140_4946 [Limisphaerales bacterium]|nr:MAG: Uncharacterized protein FD140_4946 [Limisphaerales bacterium]